MCVVNAGYQLLLRSHLLSFHDSNLILFPHSFMHLVLLVSWHLLHLWFPNVEAVLDFTCLRDSEICAQWEFSMALYPQFLQESWTFTLYCRNIEPYLSSTRKTGEDCATVKTAITRLSPFPQTNYYVTRQTINKLKM